MKTKEQVYKLIQNYVKPHFDLCYNPNLKNDTKQRLKISRPLDSVHNGAGPESEPVLTEYSDKMIFGAYIRNDNRTIEYDDDTRIMFVIHEIAHLLCLRSLYNPIKHSPDLYAWQINHPKANKYYYWCVQEEMSAGFLGFLIQAKLDIVWECLYYDSTDYEISSKLIFPNKFIDLPKNIPKELKQKCHNNKLWMACDADLSPLFRLPFDDDYNNKVIEYPAFKMFGSYHHQLLGILDNDNNIIGTINSKIIKQNKEKIQKLWKIHPSELDDFLEFWCL